MEIYSKEWKLCMKKWLLQMLGMELLGFLIGFGLLNIVLYVESDSTYVYLGTFFALFLCYLSLFQMGAYQTNRYRLLLSMGQKRSNVILSQILWMISEMVVLSISLVCFYLFEKKMYPIWYADRMLDEEMRFDFLPHYVLLIMALSVVIVWLFFALSLKFGPKIFIITYLVLLFVCTAMRRIIERNAFIQSVATEVTTFLLSLSSITWWLAGTLLIFILFYIGYGIWYNYDVK